MMRQMEENNSSLFAYHPYLRQFGFFFICTALIAGVAFTLMQYNRRQYSDEERESIQKIELGEIQQRERRNQQMIYKVLQDAGVLNSHGTQKVLPGTSNNNPPPPKQQQPIKQRPNRGYAVHVSIDTCDTKYNVQDRLQKQVWEHDPVNPNGQSFGPGIESAVQVTEMLDGNRNG